MMMKASTTLQKVSGYLALIFSVLSLSVLCTWLEMTKIGALEDDPALHRGGLNWSDSIFNWKNVFDDFWMHSFLRLGSFGVSPFSIRSYRE